MKKPNHLSDNEIVEHLNILIIKEKKLQTQIILYLWEVEDRKLYLKRGHGSLFDFVTRELKYSESAASRRINSMRLLKNLEKLKENLSGDELKDQTNNLSMSYKSLLKNVENGELHLTTLSSIYSFLKRERKAGKKYSFTQQNDIINKIHNKSSRETEKILSTLSPKSAQSPDKIKRLSENELSLSITVKEETLHQIEKLKSLLSHKMPNASLSEIIEYVVEQSVLKLDPELKNKPEKHTSIAFNPNKKINLHPKQLDNTLTQVISTDSNPPPLQSHRTSAPKLDAPEDTTQQNNSDDISNYKISKLAPQNRQIGAIIKTSYLPRIRAKSRYIPTTIRRLVFIRDEGKCAYVSKQTGWRCGSRHRLEIEHIIPVSKGGSNHPSNLTLYCKEHNQFSAIQSFGINKMSKFYSILPKN